MSTPLFSAVEKYVSKNMARFHMPGHKGALSPYDITEVEGCDSLYEAVGAIAETERRYAELYGAAASYISAGGSTLCIQAMLALAAGFGAKIIAGRNIHVSAVNAMALLDITPVWAYPEIDPETCLAKAVSPAEIRRLLSENPDASAVYITSPDYFGVICDIAAIKSVCAEFNVPLMVDNAHGAHLKFLRPSLHPLDLGADICCDSLHKTLPVFTGGAMLHVKSERYIESARRFMSLFGSTSPSYLIMLSIDRALEDLEKFPEKLSETARAIARLAALSRARGFALPGGVCDPVRLPLGFAPLGYGQKEFGEAIRRAGIEPEYIGGHFCVLMASPYNVPEDFERLERFIAEIPALIPLEPVPFVFQKRERVLTPREAASAETVVLPPEQALNKIAGGTVATCPPGIPLIIPGERIDENLPAVLKNYGISRVLVLK